MNTQWFEATPKRTNLRRSPTNFTSGLSRHSLSRTRASTCSAGNEHMDQHKWKDIVCCLLRPVSITYMTPSNDTPHPSCHLTGIQSECTNHMHALFPSRTATATVIVTLAMKKRRDLSAIFSHAWQRKCYGRPSQPWLQSNRVKFHAPLPKRSAFCTTLSTQRSRNCHCLTSRFPTRPHEFTWHLLTLPLRREPTHRHQRCFRHNTRAHSTTSFCLPSPTSCSRHFLLKTFQAGSCLNPQFACRLLTDTTLMIHPHNSTSHIYLPQTVRLQLKSHVSSRLPRAPASSKTLWRQSRRRLA